MSEIYGFTQSQSTELLRMLQAYKAGQLGGGVPTSPQGNLRPDIVPFKFVESGETLLPYGIAEVYGVVTAGEPRLLVRRPTGDESAQYVINTNASIAHNANGWGTLATCAPALALYDEAEAPAFGQEWGPQDASFKLKKSNAGFICQGTGTAGSPRLVSVLQQRGSGDRVEAFMLNEQLDAMSSASATVLDDDGILTTETITLHDIIMSPGDFVASGSKGWMRLRNGEWKIIVPYCKPTGETSPPPQIIEPNPDDIYWPAGKKTTNYQFSTALTMSATSAYSGEMTSEGAEIP